MLFLLITADARGAAILPKSVGEYSYTYLEIAFYNSVDKISRPTQRCRFCQNLAGKFKIAYLILSTLLKTELLSLLENGLFT